MAYQSCQRNGWMGDVAPLFFVVALMTVWQAGTSADAQVRNWNNASGGSYHTATNWTPNDVPDTVLETARFALGNSYAVNFNSGSTVNVAELVVDAGRVIFQSSGIVTYNVSGQTLIRGDELALFETAGAGRIDLIGADVFVSNKANWKLDAGSQSTIDSLFVGGTSPNLPATVEIRDGSELNLRNGEVLSIGVQSAGTSRLTVTNANSFLRAGLGDIHIGANGQGLMEVLDRAEVKAPLANVNVGTGPSSFGSRLTLSGGTSFSTFDSVSSGYGVTQVGTGTSGQGIVEVLNGSRFEAGDLIAVGTSQVTVDDSELHSTGIGLTNTSSLVVQNGSLFELPSFGGDSINERASLTVTGAGSEILATTGISVNGTNPVAPVSINVLAGGLLHPDSTSVNFLELFVENRSEINVSGAGSMLDTGDGRIELGGATSATPRFNVNSGGTAIVNHLAIGNSGSEAGIVQIDGGTLTAAKAELAASKPNASVLNGGTAVVDILPGGLFNVTGALILGTDATVNLYGGELRLADFANVQGYDATVNWNNGTVRVDAGTTLVPYASGLLLPDGTLRFGQRLHITGNLTLQTAVVLDGGTLAVEGLTNKTLLQLKSGTFEWLDSDLPIDASGPLGGMLDLGPNLTVKVGGTISNSGVVTGDGTLDGSLVNSASGIVRVEQGKSLAVVGGASHSNAGEIQLLGGRIDFSGDLSNGATGIIGGRGTLAVAGKWNNVGNAAFSAGFTDVFGDVANTGTGAIIATGGATVTFYDDVAHNGAEIRTSANSNTVFFGDVTGAGPFTGTGTNYFEGDLQPGNSPASVSFAGDVVFGALAGLTIEIAGSAPGSEFDVLSINSEASLDGELEVQLINGFTPTIGQSFEILTAAGGLSGVFASESLPDLGALVDLRVFYGTDHVTLSVVPTLLGDYNGDGLVNAADYTVWRDARGQNGLGLAADGNGDEAVNQLDYGVWTANFGTTAGNGALAGEAPAVPEPGVVAMLGAVAVAAAVSRQ